MAGRGHAMGLAVAVAIAGFVVPASAALPPALESIREINTILADPRLGDALGGTAIVSTTDNGKGGYVFATKTCSVTVDVLDAPPSPDKRSMPGPRQFTLQFEQPVCK